MCDNPFNFQRQEWQPSASARRFEAGSPNSLGQVALHASLGLLLRVGMETVAQRILGNSDYLNDRLGGLPGISVNAHVSSARQSGIVSFSHQEIPAQRLHTLLANAGITVSVRGHSIRVSPHFYQDESDLARFILALEQII